MTPAIADASLVDGPARTVVLIIGGVAVLGWLVAWLLCRAAAVGDRVEPGCDEQAGLDCQGRHGYRCLLCDEPQAPTEAYDHVAIERLHADLAAWERGER